MTMDRPTAVKPPRKAALKRKPAVDPAKGLARALAVVDKLGDQNHDAGHALRSLSSLWLSPDANRRKSEAEVALNHFDGALAALRKSLAAM
jgi:hypothetical protein